MPGILFRFEVAPRRSVGQLLVSLLSDWIRMRAYGSWLRRVYHSGSGAMAVDRKYPHLCSYEPGRLRWLGYKVTAGARLIDFDRQLRTQRHCYRQA